MWFFAFDGFVLLQGMIGLEGVRASGMELRLQSLSMSGLRILGLRVLVLWGS